MVVFTCANCGDSLKKNRVEKHYQTVCSRKSVSLTCVDCCKDFSAETFPAHTKCVTEEERYSAKGFVPRPSANKGEKKQQKWQEIVQSLQESQDGISHEERSVLNIIIKHENVPRKKHKFQNFLRSVMNNRYNTQVAESLFDKIEAYSKETEVESKKEDEKSDEKENGNNEEQGEKLSKKEKKEKKKIKSDAESKELENNDLVETENVNKEESRKKKKAKKEAENESLEAEEGEEDRKKKKAKKEAENESLEAEGEDGKKKKKAKNEVENESLEAEEGEEDRKKKKAKKEAENETAEAEHGDSQLEVQSKEENETDVKENEKVSKKEKKEKRKRAKYEAELKEIENAENLEVEDEDEGKKRKKSKKGVVTENGLEDEKPRKKHKGDGSEVQNSISEDNDLAEGGKAKKKHKKETDVVENETLQEVESSKSKKKRKKGQDEEVELCAGEPTEKKIKESDKEAASTGKVSFNWQEIITKVLGSKDSRELPLKRLQKKVLAEHEALGCGSATDVKTIAKFNKKVQKTPGVKIHKEVVKLVTEN